MGSWGRVLTKSFYDLPGKKVLYDWEFGKTFFFVKHDSVGDLCYGGIKMYSKTVIITLYGSIMGRDG